MQRIGVDIHTLVLRRKWVNASRTESFDYKCREHHTCGCRYALTVHFDPNGFGTIKSIEREHNAHRPRCCARVSMTREQKTFLLNAVELGVAPFRITAPRPRERGVARGRRRHSHLRRRAEQLRSAQQNMSPWCVLVPRHESLERKCFETQHSRKLEPNQI